MRRVLFSLLVIFFSVALLSLAPEDNRLEEGMKVPKFFLRMYNEVRSGYSVIRGEDLFNGKNKAVVISFFASYCKPCKKEIFVLNEFYNAYKEKGVFIVEISIDNEPEGIQLFKKIVDEGAFTMPCVVDTMGVMARRFGVDRLPTLFVFDKYGYVKKRFEGYTEENVRNFEKVVLNLIEGKPIDKSVEKKDGGPEEKAKQEERVREGGNGK
jgi:alkyl hydroperoxide reductase subunit AhpC